MNRAASYLSCIWPMAKVSIDYEHSNAFQPEAKHGQVANMFSGSARLRLSRSLCHKSDRAR